MADTKTTDSARAAAEAAAQAQMRAQGQSAQGARENGDFVTQVAERIAEANNILVALSKDPSVDEMAAAIGLTLFLDSLGKHATAIYSGATPNALQFLKPDETFENNTNSLRDFIIALDKEKADHLRYKLDGDYVKVYITPYKTTIDEGDLKFSHGDYNVELVLALNVPTANDLDAALAEHGRIMHDASAIDITTGEPGKFGEIEWSDTDASSVSELATRLVLKLQTADVRLTANEATAFLTGIVAETESFSNKKTTPAVMAIASQLMEMGANQQLVATNIAKGEDEPKTETVDATAGNDPTALNVRGGATTSMDDMPVPMPESLPVDNTAATATPVVSAAAAPVAPVVATPVVPAAPVVPPATQAIPTAPAAPAVPVDAVPTSAPASGILHESEQQASFSSNTPAEDAGLMGGGVGQTIQPEPGFRAEMENTKDYGAMIDAALAEGVPAAPEKPEVNNLPAMDYTPTETTPVVSKEAIPAPENEVVLPPPPTPEVDFNQILPTDANGMPMLPEVQEAQPAQPATQQPVVQEPVAQPNSQPAQPAQPVQPTDPSAFRIPGM